MQCTLRRCLIFAAVVLGFTSLLVLIRWENTKLPRAVSITRDVLTHPQYNPSMTINLLKHTNTPIHPIQHEENGKTKNEFNEGLSRFMEIVASERRSNAHHACGRFEKEHNLTIRGMLSIPSHKRPRLYFSDNYKLIICEVPKCGSSHWRKALLMMEGDVTVTSPDQISGAQAAVLGQKRNFWKNFNGSDEKEVLEMERKFREYYRVITVREPFQRIVSAYNDKMLPTGSGGKTYGAISRKIHQQYKNMTLNEDDDAYASWEEFVRYLLDQNKKVPMDAHWDFYSTICDPCGIEYDYVAKLETISTDVIYLSSKLGYDLTPLFPDGREKLRGHKWEEKYVRNYLKNTKDEVRKLYEMYKEQYELFGYEKPTFVT